MPSSIVYVLLRNAETRPDSLALRLKTPSGWQTWTWSEYWLEAEKAAAALHAAGIRPSDHVLVFETDPRRAVPALFGLWILGAVPTLAAIPDSIPSGREGIANYVQRLAQRLDSDHILAPPHLQSLQYDLSGLNVLSSELEGDGPRIGPRQDFDSSDPATIQLTSGTTSEPRGIVISHENLTLHMERIKLTLGFGDGQSAMSWLPLHHDLGLYCGLLLPLICGFPCTLMSPREFRRRPLSWLESMSAFQITNTGGPPSAYAILLRLAQRAVEAGLRLEPWTCALIGAEHVPATLLRSFAREFAPCGFRENAFFPGYGMAECTVAVSFPKLYRPARIDTIERSAFASEGVARQCPPYDDALEFVGTGTAIPGVDVRIVDDTGADLPDRAVGEIYVRTTSGMSHYYKDPEATAKAFDNGWLRTGDLGYLVDGEIFVVGRKKDLIIKGGQNMSPCAIEAAVETVDGVRPGAAAAVALYSEVAMTDLACVVVERAVTEKSDSVLEQTIRLRLSELGLPVDRVVLVPLRTLPRTTSGKLRRGELAQMLRLGRLGSSC